MKYWWIIIFVLCAVPNVGAEDVVEDSPSHRHHFSVGFLDHRTGMSLASYSRTLLANESHELFVGVGSVLAMTTLAVGWKFYAFHYYVDFYCVVAGHAAAGMSDKILVAPFASLGIELGITDDYFLNVGVNNTLRLYVKDFKMYRDPELVVFPHASVTHRW